MINIQEIREAVLRSVGVDRTQPFTNIPERADANVLVRRSPNHNAYKGRLIQSVYVECLDRFLIFGERRFNYLV